MNSSFAHIVSSVLIVYLECEIWINMIKTVSQNIQLINWSGVNVLLELFVFICD